MSVRLRVALVFAFAMAIALIGYTVFPTAPPRFYPEYGFTDTLNSFSEVNHDSAFVKQFINPFAAVPSMHCAFALMIGATGFQLVRHWWTKALWVAWPLLVAYDGSGFRGFARQADPTVPTVAGVLAGAIARTARLEGPPSLVCAGRTDAGVHALGQVVHVDLPAAYDGDLARACTRQLAPGIVVRAAAPAPEGFDARRHATPRPHRYRVRDAKLLPLHAEAKGLARGLPVPFRWIPREQNRAGHLLE